jgi:hypothetical protein
VGHHRALHGEPFDVRRLLGEERRRDEQRKVGVDVPGVLEAAIEVALDRLPQRVALGPDDHAALDRRIVGELRRLDDVEVPLRIVFGARLDVLGHEAEESRSMMHAAVVGEKRLHL